MERVSPVIFFETANGEIKDAFWLVTNRLALCFLIPDAINNGIEAMATAVPDMRSIDTP